MILRGVYLFDIFYFGNDCKFYAFSCPNHYLNLKYEYEEDMVLDDRLLEQWCSRCSLIGATLQKAISELIYIAVYYISQLNDSNTKSYVSNHGKIFCKRR